MTTAWLGRLRFENPVLSKDLRTRMRGIKAFLVQGFYVGVLVLVMGIAYLAWWASHRAGASPVAVSSQLGRMLYLLVFEIQAGLVALITPALTAGAVTIEHEQRTYELLACTRIAPRTILTGKLLSAWLFIVMLLTCSLPLAALCLMFGGVSGSEIFWAYVMLCVSALFFGSVGVFYSSLLTRSMIAVMLTYGTLGFYLALTAFPDPRGPGPLWAINPFAYIVDPIEPIRLYSHSLPGWLPALVVLPIGAVLLLNWGISRLRHFAADRALAIRALVVLLLVVLTLFTLGRASAGAPPGAWGPGYTGASQASYLAVVTGGGTLLLMLALLFATGERPNPLPRSLLGWMITGFDPRRMMSKQLRGGWAYMLLLAAIFAVTLKLAGHAGFRATLATFLVLGAVILCYSALGALGAAANSRLGGVALIALAIVLLQTVPGAMWLNSGPPGSPHPELVSAHYALYLAPWWALSLGYQPSLNRYMPSSLLPPAAPPVWAVTAILYLLMAVAGFALAETVYQVCRRRVAARART